MGEIEKNNLNQLEAEITILKHQTAQNIIEIGRRLVKAKELVPYGEWGLWLENKVDFSQSMANKFMKVAMEFSDSESIPKVGLSKLIMLTTVDPEERETFIEENPVEDMTTRELQQAIKEKKDLEKQIEELRNQGPQIIEKEKIVEREVYPKDYDQLKDRLKNSIDRNNFNDLKREFEEKIDENYELKKQIQQLSKTDSKERHREKLKDNTLIFCNRIHSFLNDVGGLAWLTDYIEELDDYDKRSYYKALDLLESWVLTVKSNINKEEF